MYITSFSPVAVTTGTNATTELDTEPLVREETTPPGGCVAIPARSRANGTGIDQASQSDVIFEADDVRLVTGGGRVTAVVEVECLLAVILLVDSWLSTVVGWLLVATPAD